LDAAGVIVSVGSNVQHLKPGQRVVAFPANGSYAEFVVAEENLTFVIPDNIGFETAAACPTVSFLAYKLLGDIARIERGETVILNHLNNVSPNVIEESLDKYGPYFSGFEPVSPARVAKAY
jgi:NADPH:quinone reductase